MRLDAAAADALLELLPPELGILEQELAKLSLLVGKSGAIDVSLVAENVGGWRTRTTWDMVDAAAEGRAAEALEQLGRLDRGRRKAARTVAADEPFAAPAGGGDATDRSRPKRPAAGCRCSPRCSRPVCRPSNSPRPSGNFGNWAASGPSSSPSWLLAADLAIKGHNSADARARLELERLIVRLASAN